MLLPLLFLAATADGPGRDPAKGDALLHGCQAELRLMERASLAEAPPIDLINGAYCLGYLNGFSANLPATVCTEGNSMAALVRSYVAFMSRNPQLLEQDKRVGLRLALEAAYPCSAQP